MGIVWLSANKFGYELLKEAVKIKGVKVELIITLSDKATTVMYDGVERDKWNEFGIEVRETKNINNELEFLKKQAPELIVICGWRQIIDKGILKIPKKGVVGFHPTLLPIGRGPAPLINSILQGFTKSGITMFYVGDGLDDGDIIGQKRFVINDYDHASEVYEKMIESGKTLIKKYLHDVIKGQAPRKEQDESKATMFSKPSLKDNKINFEMDSIDKMYRKIKALSKPYKGAYIEKDGKKLIFWRAELIEK